MKETDIVLERASIDGRGARRTNTVSKYLYQSWSKWREENQAKGQCGVTALVVNDLLGGDIKKTYLNDGWHYDNFIDGKRHDFTASPFYRRDCLYGYPFNKISSVYGYE